MLKKYVVSYDTKSKKYYAHMENFPYVPITGSFSDKKSEAREYAKMYMFLPNKVQEIEEKKRKTF